MAEPLSELVQRLRLGEGTETVEVDSSEALRALSLALISQARRELLVVSRHLDGMIYDNAEISQAVRDFVLSGRNTRVRILVKDAGPAVRDSHRLIALAQRLSSYIEIRVLAPEFAEYNSAFLVADSIGYIHRQLSDRLEASVDFNSTQHATALSREFNAMWESALPDPSMRRLYL